MHVARGFRGMVAVALFLLAIVPTAGAKYSGGNGTARSPYQIATAADLVLLGGSRGDYDKHFILTADIDMDPRLPGRKVFDKAVIAPGIDDTNWGSDGTPFAGVFDGNGHVISHLRITGGGCLGLFGSLRGEIKNLGLVDVRVNGSKLYVGGLVGVSISGSVTDCYSTGAISNVSHNVGGLVGTNYGSISTSSSTGSVRGNLNAGGLVGVNQGGTVSQCYSTGAVNGIGNYTGGLVGINVNGTVTQCYSASMVIGYRGENVGGLVGEDWLNGGTVTASFWDTEASGQTTSAGATGKTTAEMQTTKTFLDAGWDFVGETANGTEDIWWIDEGKSYPRLSGQGPADIVFVNIPAGMVFVNIPAGTFEMGDHQGDGYPDEVPVHTVVLEGFQMSKYETTNAQYAQYLNAARADGLIQVANGVVYASSDNNKSQPYFDTRSADYYSQIDYSQGKFLAVGRDGKSASAHPVVRVSWYGARAFCDYYGYRLPTEAEWEYAARGGYYDPYYSYPWGSNDSDCSKANCDVCNPLNVGATWVSFPWTSPVGYYGEQGAYSLCDMSGNTWEWCQDWYASGYYGVSPVGSPAGPSTGNFRIMRGSSWYTGSYLGRVSNRGRALPDGRGLSSGFRVCR